MKWESKKLKYLCTITSSKRCYFSQRVSNGVAFYRSKEIINLFNGQEVMECDYIPIVQYQEIKNKFGVPQKDDLLLTTRGTIGVPYLYKETDSFYFADGNLTWFKDFTKDLLPQYLYYWFTTHDGAGIVDSIAVGSAQQAVPISALKEICINLPPFTSQQRIAGILSAYDDLIENNQRQIKLLEEAAMLLYKEWFVKLRFPGHENMEIVDGLPEGWRKGTLHELIDIKYGKDHKKLNDGDIPIYGSGGVMRNGNKSLYMGASVLIPRKGSLNNIMFVDQGFWTVDTMFYSVPKRAFIMPYVYLYLKGWDMYAMNTGAAVPSTTTETLNAMQVFIPPEHLLEKFDIVVQNCFSCADALKKQIHQAQAARDKLLPKLMNGEIEVL